MQATQLGEASNKTDIARKQAGRSSLWELSPGVVFGYETLPRSIEESQGHKFISGWEESSDNGDFELSEGGE